MEFRLYKGYITSIVNTIMVNASILFEADNSVITQRNRYNKKIYKRNTRGPHEVNHDARRYRVIRHVTGNMINDRNAAETSKSITLYGKALLNNSLRTVDDHHSSGATDRNSFT